MGYVAVFGDEPELAGRFTKSNAVINMLIILDVNSVISAAESGGARECNAIGAAKPCSGVRRGRGPVPGGVMGVWLGS